MNNSSNKIEIILSAVDRGLKAGISGAVAGVKELSSGAGNASAKMRVLGTDAQHAGSGLSVAQKSANTLEKTLGNLKGVIAGVFAAGQIKGFVEIFARTADAMRDLDQRLLLTAKNTADYVASQQTVIDVARVAHQEIAVVGTLYTRMALATANLSTSQKDLADVTKTVALATALSGSAASESAAGLQQFAQAMSSDRLQGEELRSVLENIPMLAKVFVDAAGGSMAKLREMAEKGELTTRWMINAIKAAQATIEAQAAAMPPTVGRAMTDLKNEFSIYVDQVNKATGATDIMAASIQWLGQNLDIVAKGGVLALTTALSVMVGRGLTAAAASTTAFLASLTRVTPAITTTSLLVDHLGRAMTTTTAATSVTTATIGSRLLASLSSLINPITAVTTVLGIGAAAWMMWGRSADDELSKAKGRLAELKRTNQMLKELSDPGVRLQNTAKNIEAAKAEVATLEADLAKAVAEPSNIPFDNTIGITAEQLDKAKQKLSVLEQEHAETQKNIEITTQQRGAKEVAVEMSVTDAIKKQDEERRKVTASKLDNDLAEIEKKRAAELKTVSSQYSKDDQERVRKAINARFDAEVTKAKEENAEREAKASDKAAKAADRAAKKEEKAAEKQLQTQREIAAEKLRFSSQEKILAMELEKIEAGKLGTKLQRAEAEMAIDKRIMAERINLKRQELAALQADAARPDSNTSQADVIRAQAEIAAMQVEAVKQEHANLAQVVSERLTEVEQAWRRGQMSVEQYREAVRAAGAAGVITADEMREKMVAAGDDMGAALSLGFQHAREKMQTDAEVMISIGEQIGDQIAGGLASAWDSYITGSASAKEAMIDFARSTISWLSQIILKQMLLNALQSMGFGFSAGGQAVQAFAGGGWVQALAGGGAVQGWSPSKTSDNIPAWLTAKEFVHPVDAVDYYGLPFMEAVRRKLFPRNLARALAGATLPRIPSGYRLAQGGQAAAAPATTVKAGDVKLAVVNVRDESEIHRYINSATFDTILINKIRRNGSAIKTILG